MTRILLATLAAIVLGLLAYWRGVVEGRKRKAAELGAANRDAVVEIAEREDERVRRESVRAAESTEAHAEIERERSRRLVDQQVRAGDLDAEIREIEADLERRRSQR